MARGTIFCLESNYDFAQVTSLARQSNTFDVPCELSEWPDEDLLARRLRPLSGFGYSSSTFETKYGEVTLYSVEGFMELPRARRAWHSEEGLLPHALRVRQRNADLLFFKRQTAQGERMFLSIGISSPKSVADLRQGIIVPVWGDLLPATDLHIDDDLMYWLWSKLLIHGGAVSNHCFLSQIHNFSSRPMGSCRLQGKGDIGNLTEALTTLAKNEQLWQIGVELEHHDESMIVTLRRDGQVAVVEGSYTGEYAAGRSGPEFRALLLHYVYDSLIPDLQVLYDGECQRGLWGGQQRSVFVDWCRSNVRERMGNVPLGV